VLNTVVKRIAVTQAVQQESLLMGTPERCDGTNGFTTR
jgi:hypothetical protein